MENGGWVIMAFKRSSVQPVNRLLWLPLLPLTFALEPLERWDSAIQRVI